MIQHGWHIAVANRISAERSRIGVSNIQVVTPASNKGAFKAPLAAPLSARALAPPSESRVFRHGCKLTKVLCESQGNLFLDVFSICLKLFEHCCDSTPLWSCRVMSSPTSPNHGRQGRASAAEPWFQEPLVQLVVRLPDPTLCHAKHSWMMT